VNQYLEALLDYADRRMSAEIGAIKDGVYYGEGWVDSDGYDQFDIPIKVKVTIDGDSVSVDCTGSGPQAQGAVNGSYATTQAAAKIPFMCYIDPDIPHNYGCLKHIEVFAPEGTICNARFPAATSAATIVPSDAIQDAINKAMAAAVPDLVPAGGARCGNVAQLTGVDNVTGEPWGLMEFNNTVGAGGAKGADGWPLYESVGCAGGLKAQAIEELELLYPILIEQMEVEVDSMGFGEWNGGPGNRFVVRPTRGSMECITFGDGYRNPPHGVLGGSPGIGGGMYVVGRDGRKQFFSATAHVAVGPDEILVGIASGGGGWGNPLERDVQTVCDDVRDGFVSVEAARRVYGLDVDAAGVIVDPVETERLRAELAASARPLIEPVEPNSATWLEENMSDGDEYLENPRPLAAGY
jgi:N-methylhydantoinase B